MVKGFQKGIKGFTLIELIIAISIFALVIVLAGSLFFSGFNGYIENNELIAGQSGVRLAIFEINNKLRLADPSSVSVEGGGTTIVIGDTAFSFIKNPADEYGTITEFKNGNSKPVADYIEFFEASVEPGTSIITIKAKSKWSDTYLEAGIELGSIPTPSPTP